MMKAMKYAALTALTAASVLTPAEAQAATGSPSAGSHSTVVKLVGGSLEVTAQSGRANNITVDRHSWPGFIVIKDTGDEVVLKPGSPCVQSGSNAVRCQARPLRIQAGDRGDTIAVNTTTLGTSLSGGPGPDVIKGGGTQDYIYGGTGGDVVDGRGGNDVIRGEGGSDTLRGAGGNDTIYGGLGRDDLFGGPGTDTLDSRDGTVRNDHLNGEGGYDHCYSDPDFMDRCEE